MAIKDYEFWFIVGTQHLYGEEIFADINSHAQDMCDEWSKKLPCKVVAKPCVKTSSEISNKPIIRLIVRVLLLGCIRFHRQKCGFQV